VIDANLPEATRLAKTVETWWPAILVALIHDVSNARTKGFNRVIKQTKRIGCGFRSQVNYQRRIVSHIAVARPQRSAATGHNPAQIRRAGWVGSSFCLVSDRLLLTPELQTPSSPTG
jgi:hypothetical protein